MLAALFILIPILIRNILFLFFLGLPGLAFQAIGGLAGILYTIAFCSTSGLAPWELGFLLIPMAVYAVGATMQAHYDSIQGVHLSMAEVLTAVTQNSLALLAIMSTTAALILLAKGEFFTGIIAGSLTVLSCAGFAACVVRRRKLYRQSLEDFPEDPAS